MIKNLLPRLALAGLFLALISTTGSNASAQNVLANPGFEAGPVGFGAPGWTTFGNGFTEAADPCLVPHSGTQLMKMFGTFNPFGVSGIFQEFPTVPGEQWALSAHSRHCSDDPMLGDHVNGGAGNWVVQKIAFFDASNVEIGAAAVESTILDGSFPINTWFNNTAIVGTAPAGCVKLQAFVLYLQPGFDGGAAQIDDVSLTNVTPTPVDGTSWGHVKSLYRN